MTSHQVCNVRRDKTPNLRQQFAPHFSRSSGPPLFSIRMAIASRTFVERKYILDQWVSLGHNSDDSKQEVPYGGDITETLLKRGNSATSCCALRGAAGLGKLCVTVLPATLGVSRNCGSWPGSLGLAQWQEGLSQRRVTAVIEPGRRSPKPRNSCRSLDRSASKAARDQAWGSRF